MPSPQPSSLSPLTTSNLQRHSLMTRLPGPSPQVVPSEIDQVKSACIAEVRGAAIDSLRGKSVNKILNFAQEHPESLRAVLSPATFAQLQTYAEEHEEASSESVSVQFEDLSAVLTGIQDRRERLRRINESLKEMRTEQDLTMTDIVKAIRRHGICLANGKAYGSQLRAELRNNKSLIVPLKLAKEFKYVKKCLVRLS